MQRQQYEMQRQSVASQQQYLELLRHLVTVGAPPPAYILTLALPFSGPSSHDQPSFQFTSPQLQVPQSFESPSYTPIQTGFTPTPSHTTVATSSGLSVSEAVLLPVTGTSTTEIVPLLVASTDPPAFGSLQAQVTETAPLVASSAAPVPASL
jgi:hypothetical protein